MGDANETQETGRVSWSYCGEAWTDRHGRATVVLPPAARLSQVSFAYALIAADPEVKAELIQELRDGFFVMATDRPHAKVVWRLTELRHRAAPPSTTEGATP